MTLNTHLEISPELCGNILVLEKDKAVVEMFFTKKMKADTRGLIHGGFIFGMADYAAMCAINDPNVVLGSACTKFLKPSLVGDRVLATATVSSQSKNKFLVTVHINSAESCIFSGEFTCFVLEKHVLDL